MNEDQQRIRIAATQYAIDHGIPDGKAVDTLFLAMLHREFSMEVEPYIRVKADILAKPGKLTKRRRNALEQADQLIQMIAARYGVQPSRYILDGCENAGSGS